MCVVIPVLDEEASIGGVIERIPRDAVDEIIVADGGSKDGTIEIAKAMGARVLHAGKGYGRACLAGAAAASERSRIIVYMDGDGSDFPEELPEARCAHRRGRARLCDRFPCARPPRTRLDGLRHQLASGRAIGAMVGLLYGFRYTDMCAFRAIRRDTLLSLGMREMTYGWNLEMQMKAAREGLRILEIPRCLTPAALEASRRSQAQFTARRAQGAAFS